VLGEARDVADLGLKHTTADQSLEVTGHCRLGDPQSFADLGVGQLRLGSYEAVDIVQGPFATS
jgi:hypothetical protein